jgi:P27 family predicted phage terminase small subunit
MGLRGRKSADHLNVVRMSQERPTPPKDISRLGRKIWKEIVDSLPPGWFLKGAYRLLFAYCEAAAVHADACAIIKKLGLLLKNSVGGVKTNPAISIQTAKAGEMAMLASKLRLSPSAYRDKSAAGTEGRERPQSKRAGMMFGDGD